MAAVTARPPVHAVIFVVSATLFSLCALPSLEEIDAKATVETFSRQVLPDGDAAPSPETIGWIRVAFAAFVFGVSARTVMGDGYEIHTHYLASSKLKPCTFQLKRLRTQTSFTDWSWNLLGLAFLLSGLIPLLVSHGKEEYVHRNPWILRLALLCFETAAPVSFLVSAVVKYAIWPELLSKRQKTDILKTFTCLMKHNANVLFVLFEMGLLGGIPVVLSHVSVALLYGSSFVYFAWFMTHRWAPEHGPQFTYFFLDCTLGRTTTVALVLLLAVLLAFHSLCAVADGFLAHLGGGLPAHLLAVLLSLLCVCRFRD